MPEEYEKIKLQKSEELKETLESKHILDDEIKMVIQNAESTGEKFYQPESNNYLAKLRIGEATFYTIYSVAGEDTYVVHTAYFHRTELKE